jgi:hypothetical protein
LSGVNLSGSDTNLSGAVLSRAKLSEANLSWANLSRANLSGADISTSIIIEPQNYEEIKLNEKTNFENAISDNIYFIYHASEYTKNISNMVKNKKELKSKLEKMLFNKQELEFVLKASKLPEE